MTAKTDAARLLGKAGGDARAEALLPSRRSEIARIAALARWHGRSAPSCTMKTQYRSEYLAYCNARLRCTNPKNKSWPHYGGRGIKFLLNSFEELILDIGVRPDGHVLDRIDNDGHYECGNLRWATVKESNVNRSRA